MGSQIAQFCQNCFHAAKQVTTGAKCPKCGANRLLRHHELGDLAIAHIDCDAFFAAIEKRDRPDLQDKPLIIGGGQRGVVSTACYLARQYGVFSAMPMFKARKLCPQAEILPPDIAKYRKTTHQIRSLMAQITPVVEPVSLDEAFLDLTGTEKLHQMPPAMALARLGQKIAQKTGITVSIGLSYCRFLAKIASDYQKPNGFFIIGRAQAQDFLRDLPVTKLSGVGPVLSQKLRRARIFTFGDLRHFDKSVLTARFGQIGATLYERARGHDPRPIGNSQPAKSLSVETTFTYDIADLSRLEQILWRLAEQLSRRAKASRICAKAVRIKLKKADFQSFTRTHRFAGGKYLAQDLYDGGRKLLRQACCGEQFRLLGLEMADLAPIATSRQFDLFKPLATDDGRETQAERAENLLDDLQKRYGVNRIFLGRGWQRKTKSGE